MVYLVRTSCSLCLRSARDVGMQLVLCDLDRRNCLTRANRFRRKPFGLGYRRQTNCEAYEENNQHAQTKHPPMPFIFRLPAKHKTSSSRSLMIRLSDSQIPVSLEARLWSSLNYWHAVRPVSQI